MRHVAPVNGGLVYANALSQQTSDWGTPLIYVCLLALAREYLSLIGGQRRSANINNKNLNHRQKGQFLIEI